MSKAIDTHTYSFQLHNRFSTLLQYRSYWKFKKKYKNKKPVQTVHKLRSILNNQYLRSLKVTSLAVMCLERLLLYHRVTVSLLIEPPTPSSHPIQTYQHILLILQNFHQSLNLISVISIVFNFLWRSHFMTVYR